MLAKCHVPSSCLGSLADRWVQWAHGISKAGPSVEEGCESPEGEAGDLDRFLLEMASKVIKRRQVVAASVDGWAAAS